MRDKPTKATMSNIFRWPLSPIREIIMYLIYRSAALKRQHLPELPNIFFGPVENSAFSFQLRKLVRRRVWDLYSITASIEAGRSARPTRRCDVLARF